MGAEASRARRRISEAAGALLLLVLASGAAFALLWLPRPVEPLEAPGLHLDGRAARAVLDRDRAAIARLPDDPRTQRLRELFAEHSREEGQPRPRGPGMSRRRELQSLVRSLSSDEDGEALVAALRAEAAARAMRALDGELSAAERPSALGRFEDMMAQYGLSRDGRLVAPELVVRTLFAARWNAAHALSPVEGFSQVELEAYWGWLALESPVDPAVRADALGRYEALCGRTLPEARAVLLYLGGDHFGAAEELTRLYEAGGSVRLRNHALAGLVASM